MTARPQPLEGWHRVFESRDPALLDDLLAEDCVFRSPAVHTPQEGKALTTKYLSAAMLVLGPTLRYEHEWWDEGSAVLEFIADLDGLTVHGIDMMRWGSDGRAGRVHRHGPPVQGTDPADDADVGRAGEARHLSAPGRTRTCDLEIRRLLLYPAELRGRGIGNYIVLDIGSQRCSSRL